MAAKKAWGTLVVIVIILVLAASQTFFIVDETEQAIITQFGDYIRTVDEPGLQFKVPFIQTVHMYEKRILASDADYAEYLTLDKKRIIMDHITRWRISNPFLFYKTVRTEAAARARLDDIVIGRLREEVARHDFVELIREEREVIMETVAQDSRPRLSALGIEVVDVRIKRADLPEEVQESVFDRMEAERNRMAARYRAEGEERAQEIRAETDREREVILATAYEENQRIRGEGDARAAAIYAEAFSRDPEFFSFIRSLEAYEKFLKDDTVILMGLEAELLKYFRSPAGQ